MLHMGSDHRSVMAQFVITAPKKDVSQKTTIAKKKIKTAESTKNQDNEKRDPMKQSKSKSDTPSSKEKWSMKPKLQPTARQDFQNTKDVGFVEKQWRVC